MAKPPAQFKKPDFSGFVAGKLSGRTCGQLCGNQKTMAFVPASGMAERPKQLWTSKKESSWDFVFGSWHFWFCFPLNRIFFVFFDKKITLKRLRTSDGPESHQGHDMAHCALCIELCFNQKQPFFSQSKAKAAVCSQVDSGSKSTRPLRVASVRMADSRVKLSKSSICGLTCHGLRPTFTRTTVSSLVSRT